MELAFWNNGAPRVVRSSRRVELGNGDVLLNAKPDPEKDLYAYAEVGASRSRLENLSGPIYANDGWTVTATWTSVLKPLAELQALRLAELESFRYGVETGGMIFGGAGVPTDDRSKTLIIGARTKAKEDASYTKDWKVAAGSYVSLDATAIIAMADALEAHVAAAFANEKIHADAILALTDGQAVVDYDITTGWPENPAENPTGNPEGA